MHAGLQIETPAFGGGVRRGAGLGAVVGPLANVRLREDEVGGNDFGPTQGVRREPEAIGLARDTKGRQLLAGSHQAPGDFPVCTFSIRKTS